LGNGKSVKTIRVTIQRFNPSMETAGRFQTYDVPFSKGLSVMNVLDYIYEHVDGTLAYYSHSACRRGVCGRCLLLINGKAGLACQTPVHGDLTLETPKQFPVVRDLVYSAPSLLQDEKDIFFID
jgi:succinate dehydrogenase/fumarate reductase-like Fe-S protein